VSGPAPIDPLVGRVLDQRYEIQARIGEGGMGVVYRARQLSIDRVIALKMLNPEMASDPTWVQRFYNEGKACSRLQHPNTIRIFDFGQTADGRLFMTMEFLAGQSLRDALEPGPMTPQRVAKILIQACASLAEAHSIGIIHRDIKPDNVFLLNLAGSPDFVKLLDFSVAKLMQEAGHLRTQAGVVFGTPQYMSPEQGRGAPLDPRSDIYALGVLAFEMLSGEVPFNDRNPMQIIQMHMRAPVPPMPARVPYVMQQIVLRALEKDPARRFQSAGDMMAHCQHAFAELAGGGPSVGAGGVPKTMFATPAVGPMGQSPGQTTSQPPPGHAAGVDPFDQKTVMSASQPPPPGYAPAGYAPPAGAPAPAAVASASQKTMIAAAVAPPPGLVPGGPPPPAPGYGYPPPPAPPLGGSGDGRTVMLAPTEGVVSVAASGGVVPATSTSPAGLAGRGPGQLASPLPRPMPTPMAGHLAAEGASLTFWIVSLLFGIATGVGAFVAYREIVR
jgi:hypothetical protein